MAVATSHVVTWPSCEVCGSSDARMCRVCGKWACYDCTYIEEIDDDEYCEHAFPEHLVGDGWSSGGPGLPS